MSFAKGRGIAEQRRAISAEVKLTFALTSQRAFMCEIVASILFNDYFLVW